MRTEDFRDEIIDMYCNKNMTTVQIGSRFGFSDSAIGRFLKRNGIERVHTNRKMLLSEEQIKDVCIRYLNGETTVEISKDYDLCDNSISKVLKQNGVKLRKAVIRSRVANHDYFETIDTVDKAYFLGWMISDGAIIENKTRKNRSRVISLEINSNDRYILEMFADKLDAPKDIVKDHNKRGHSYIRFSSEKMANDLEKLGVFARKSMRNELPKIKESLTSHMLRGYFDGNGIITIDKTDSCHIAFYGSKRICEQVRDLLEEELGFNKNKISKTTCYHIWYGGNGNIRKFFKFIYLDCDSFYLKRKYEKFRKIV